MRIRVSDNGEKQVLVKWEGYRRHTWESYESMREQLPEMMDELEAESEAGTSEDEQEEVSLRTFLLAYIADHSIDPSYRWRPDQVNALDHAAWSHHPRIKENDRSVEERHHGVGQLVVIFLSQSCTRVTRQPCFPV